MSEKWNLFKYECKNAFNGMKRHWALCLSSIFTVFLAMLLIAVFVILGVHVSSFSSSAASGLSIHAVLDDDLSEEQEEDVFYALKADENVDYVIYSDKDNELELMIKEKGDAFEIYRGDANPLSDAFFVYLFDDDDIEATTERIRQIDGIQAASYGGTSIHDLIIILERIRTMSLVLIVLLLLLALYLIYNTIRTTIYSRQSEIGIMWTVGASDSFIRIPFEIEGCLIGFLGALGPYLMVFFGYPALYNALGGNFFIHTFELLPVGEVRLVLALVLFGFGLLAGFLASFLSATRYIKGKSVRVKTKKKRTRR